MKRDLAYILTGIVNVNFSARYSVAQYGTIFGPVKWNSQEVCLILWTPVILISEIELCDIE